MLTIAAMGILVIAGASANAQSRVMNVDIPFDFSAGSTSLPSGSYTVERMPVSTGNTVYAFRRAAGGASAVVMMINMSISTKHGTEPTLLFRQYGSEYFLSELRDPADNFGASVAPAKREKTLARTFGLKPTAVAATGIKK